MYILIYAVYMFELVFARPFPTKQTYLRISCVFIRCEVEAIVDNIGFVTHIQIMQAGNRIRDHLY